MTATRPLWLSAGLPQVGWDLAAYAGPIEVGAPLPWDHVESPFPRDTIAAECRRITRMLGVSRRPCE